MTQFTKDNQPANRGRKKGSVNKTTSILKNATPGILKEVIKKAQEGDISAASLVLKYSLSPKKPESDKLEMSSLIGREATLSEKAGMIVDHAMEGKCDPVVAAQLIGVIAQTVKVIEQEDIMQRMEAIEHELKK